MTGLSLFLFFLFLFFVFIPLEENTYIITILVVNILLRFYKFHKMTDVCWGGGSLGGVRVTRNRLQATSCTDDIVYINGHVYTQIATSYPMITVRVWVSVRVRVRYDVAVCVYKYP